MSTEIIIDLKMKAKKFPYLFFIHFGTTTFCYFIVVFNINVLYFFVCMRIRACKFMNSSLYKNCI